MRTLWERLTTSLRNPKRPGREFIELRSPGAFFEDAGERPAEPRPLKDAPLESVPCNLCGRMDTRVLFDEIERLDTESRVVRCPDCELVFLSPRMKQIEDSWWNALAFLESCLLPETEEKGLITDGMLDLEAIKEFHEGLLHAVRHFAPGPLLDVGASLGLFLLAARHRGWEVHGIEPSFYSARYGAGHHGLEIEIGSVYSAELPEAEFSCITMIDVLEHTLDPKRAIEIAMKALLPGGCLFISVPNYDAVSRKKAGADWAQFVSDHYYYFTGMSLAKLLRRVGFETIALEIGDPLPLHQPGQHLEKALNLREVTWVSCSREKDTLYAWAIKR